MLAALPVFEGTGQPGTYRPLLSNEETRGQAVISTGSSRVREMCLCVEAGTGCQSESRVMTGPQVRLNTYLHH